MSRKLSYGIGPKRRRYDTIAAKPTIEEWQAHLSQTGPLGGQNCTTVLLAKENEEIDVAEVMHRIPKESEKSDVFQEELRAGTIRWEDLPQPPLMTEYEGASDEGGALQNLRRANEDFSNTIGRIR